MEYYVVTSQGVAKNLENCSECSATMESETTNEFGFRLRPFGAATIGEWTVGWPLGACGWGRSREVWCFLQPDQGDQTASRRLNESFTSLLSGRSEEVGSRRSLEASNRRGCEEGLHNGPSCCQACRSTAQSTVPWRQHSSLVPASFPIEQ
jgi:hypothetical protein